MLGILAFGIIGCDFFGVDMVYKEKTRTAQFTIAPTLEQIVVSHPDYSADTLYYMIATEDRINVPIKIYRGGIYGFTYEEGYKYKMDLKIISYPVCDDMVLTGESKRNWGGMTPDYRDKYVLIKILSKTKISD
jgi:hypothetical protein